MFCFVDGDDLRTLLDFYVIDCSNLLFLNDYVALFTGPNLLLLELVYNFYLITRLNSPSVVLRVLLAGTLLTFFGANSLIRAA